ncbi:hypothetical protein CQ14_14460 [Bradyrhizobium lablabi]|uniref:Polysaccharide lyase n=1 Tax=Bradyrhizobium lablabi TaxID=722472 RepID=A0A0R3M9A8_9BRAD|nr:hypothetical protein [Bradyrhizobium lablabi]KRR16788.1 hypothetical protein CQ14_14460 [Bradyrhizobium lablabi]
MPDTPALSVNQFGGYGSFSRTPCSPALGLIVSISLCLSTLFIFLGSATPSYAAQLLFKSSFEGSLLFGEPYECGTSCWQDIKGSDAVTGYSWSPQIWQGVGMFQLLADTPVTPDTVNTYVFNELQKVVGPHGQQASALYSEIRKRGGGATQNPYLLRPSTTALQQNLYVSYWIKVQPDLLERLGSNGWWVLFEWKTNAQNRLITYINTDRFNKPYWYLKTDDLSGPETRTFWEIANRTAHVPIGEWFKFEFFWHRSSQRDGRAWQAINGQVVFDSFGPLLGGDDPIDRIMVTQVYAGGPPPLYQWVTDLEIWDGFPCGDGVPCGTKSTIHK